MMHRFLRVTFLIGIILLMTAIGVTAQVSKEVSPEMFIGAWYTTAETMPGVKTLSYPWGDGPFYTNATIIIYSQDGKVIIDRSGVEEYEIESVVREPNGIIFARLSMVTEDENPHKDTFRVRFLTQDSMLVDISGSNFFELTYAFPILYRISSPYTSQESSRKE